MTRTAALRRQRAEPGRAWIELAPKRLWEPAEPAIDLASGNLLHGRASAAQELARVAEATVDDTLWLPPVSPVHRELRDRVAQGHLERGVPVVVQLFPGDAAPLGSTAILDLTPLVLDPSSEPPASASAQWCVWPLVSGIRIGAEEWAHWANRLAECGVEVLQGIVLELEPRDRRWLVERWGESSFEEVFHGGSPPSRDFAREVARSGLAPLAARPLPEGPARRVSNLELAGALAVAAETCSRLGERESRIQGYLRAARWVEESSYDVAGLVRDGQLPVVPFVEDEPRAMLGEWVEGGESPRLEELAARYLGVDEADPA